MNKWKVSFFIVCITMVLSFGLMGNDALTVPGDYPTIQEAINEIAEGGTIAVEGGPYEEQLVIDKDLHLVGSGNPTIEAPATREERTISGGDDRVYDWVVLVEDVSDFSISGFTIDGKEDGGSNRYTGILVGNSSGTVEENEVVNISGGSEGGTSAIIAVGTQTDITLANNTVSDFRKGGIVVNSEAVGYISNNTVIGDGPIDTIAQNGIQIGFDATGTIIGNTVKDVYYDGTGYHAAGIISIQASDVLIENNDIDACDVGISISANGQNIENITVDNNILTANNRAIRVDWNGTIGGDRIIKENAFVENEWSIQMFDGEGWSISDNEFNDNHAGVALQDASVGNSIFDNVFTDNAYGVYILGSEDFGDPDNNTVNNNYFTGNSEYAVFVDGFAPNVLDATENWWGHQSGPYHPEENDTGLGDYISDYVDFSDYKESTSIYNVNLDLYYLTIQEAIGDAEQGNLITIETGEYIEEGQFVIDKDLTIEGADEENTIIRPAQDTGDDGAERGWFFVEEGSEFNLSGVTLDGDGQNIWQAIRSRGTGTIEDNIIKNIFYGNGQGTGIVSYDNMVIRNNTLSNIERIGIFAFGADADDVVIEGNTYIGKGEGEHLDYGIEVSSGARAYVEGNTITDCAGVVNDWTSAGISVSEAFAPSTEAEIVNNVLEDNRYGIYGGYGEEDESKVIADNNTFKNNFRQVRMLPTMDVDMESILADNIFDRAVVVRDSKTNEIKVLESVASFDIFSSIQNATDVAEAGDIVDASSGTYEENLSIATSSLTVKGPNAGIPGYETREAEATITGRVSIESAEIVFEGFDIAPPAATHSHGLDAEALIIQSGSNNVTIKNNIVRDFSEDGIGQWQGIDGIVAFGGQDDTPIENVEIIHNLVRNLEGRDEDGGAAGISIQGNVDGATVEYNVVHDVGMEQTAWAFGIVIRDTGNHEVSPENVDISNNTVQTIISNPATGTFGVGIGSEAQYAINPNYSIIENTIDNCEYGFEVKYLAEDIEFKYNDIINISEYAAVNEDNTQLIATHNWWDTAIESEIIALLDGDIEYDPWIGAEDGVQVEDVGEGDPEINIDIILGRADIHFRGVSVEGKVNVTFLNSSKYGPGVYGIPAGVNAVSGRVMIIETDAEFDDADLTFYTEDIPEIDGWDPKQVRVYRRSPAGEGDFSKVSWAADYNEVDETITITVNEFSEFAFIYDTTGIGDWMLY